MQRGMPVLLLLRMLSDARNRCRVGLQWLRAVGWQTKSALTQDLGLQRLLRGP